MTRAETLRRLVEGEKALAIVRWFAGGDTGISSETLALASLGITRKGVFGSDCPRDAGDSGRCERLARACPFVVDALPALIDKNPGWAKWEGRIRAAALAAKEEG